MDNQIKQVSSKTLSEKVVNQLMVFNKCTPERALCMYKEMMQTIADYYLTSQVSLKTLEHISDVDASRREIEVFAENVCNAYGLIEQHTNELKAKLC